MKNSLKKLIAVVLCVILTATAVIIIANAAPVPTFALSSASGEAGDEVEVTLSVLNNPGITALSVNIAYSADDLELLSVTKAGLFEDNISTSKLTQNPVTISWYASDSGNKTNSGDFAVLKFRIKDGAGTSGLTLSYDEDNVFNSAYDNVAFEVRNGEVTVSGAPVTPTAAPVTPPTQIPSNAPTFTLSSASGEMGDEVDVILSVLNNPGITALSVNIAYSADDLELLSVTKAGLFEDNISSSKLTQNPVTISWYASDSGNKTNSGDFAVLRFRLKDGARSSSLTLTYDEDNVFDSNYDNVAFEVINGSVTVRGGEAPTVSPTDNPFKRILGDADEDGIVSILDATAIQRYLAGYETNHNIGKDI